MIGFRLVRQRGASAARTLQPRNAPEQDDKLQITKRPSSSQEKDNTPKPQRRPHPIRYSLCFPLVSLPESPLHYYHHDASTDRRRTALLHNSRRCSNTSRRRLRSRCASHQHSQYELLGCKFVDSSMTSSISDKPSPSTAQIHLHTPFRTS